MNKPHQWEITTRDVASLTPPTSLFKCDFILVEQRLLRRAPAFHFTTNEPSHLASKLHSRGSPPPPPSPLPSPSIPLPPFPPPSPSPSSSARNRCHDEWKRKLALRSRVNFLPVQKSMSGLAQDPLPPRFSFTSRWKNCSHPLQLVPLYDDVVSVLSERCHPDRLSCCGERCWIV